MREAKFRHYKPRRWHPEFDMIVIESTCGVDNITLGRKYGYTPQHISNILSTEEAAKVKERVRGSIEKEGNRVIEDRIKNVGEKALKHIEKFIEDEANFADKRPFEFVDRALRIAQSAGTVIDRSKPAAGAGINVGNAIIVSNERATDMINAMNVSKELDDIQIEETKQLKAG